MLAIGVASRRSITSYASRWPAPAAQLHHTSRVEVHDTTGQQGPVARAATLACNAHAGVGIHPKIASERLGMARWEHARPLQPCPPGMQEEAAIKVDTLISAALLHRQKTGR